MGTLKPPPSITTITPGAGTYDIDRGANLLKSRAPGYSLGRAQLGKSRSRETISTDGRGKDTPGFNHYNIRSTIGASNHALPMNSRNSASMIKDDTPGPGSYLTNEEASTFSRARVGGKSTAVGLQSWSASKVPICTDVNYERMKRDVPAVGQYESASIPTKQMSKGYTMGRVDPRSLEMKERNLSPGPGAYESLSPDTFKNRAPGYTMHPQVKPIQTE